jgi:protocatechuate 3,4-dioxygenase beta subunit
MRPIYGLLGLAALSLLLVGVLFLWTREEPAHEAIPDSPARAASDAAPTPGAVELTAAVGATPERAVEVVPTASAPGRVETPGSEGKAQRVSGRVIDAAGKPVPNALVYAAAGGMFDDLALDEADPVEMPWFQRADTRTDSAGKFALAPKLHARVRIAVRAGGFAPLDVERTISETNPEVGDLILQAGVVLEGRVIDHLGRPVAGAELRRRRVGSGPLVFFAGRGGAVAAKSDASGAFRIDTLAVGTWNLRVTAEVAPDKDETGETTRAGEVVRGLTIQLEEGFEIAGKVTGVPAEEAGLLRVVAVPSRGDFGGDFGPGLGIGQRLAPVAADGSFTVRGCKKDGQYRISARLAGDGLGSMLRSPTRSPTADATAGERGLVLAYRAETALVFQVVDAASGAPVTSMSVAAGTRWAAPLMDDKNRPVREFPDGRVRFGGLRVSGGRGGRSSEGVTLRVESPGFAPYERKDLAVTEGLDNDLGVIRLEHTWLVKVRVTQAATGVPVSGARVKLEEIQDDAGAGRTFSFRAGSGDDDTFDFGGGNAQRGKTDADGRVSVSSIPGSRGRLVVTHPEFSEFRSEPIDLPRGVDVEREVQLLGGGTIVVRVVDATGSPVPNEALDHRGPNEEDSPMFFGPNGPLATDAEGRMTLTRQAMGVHGFRLQSAGGPRMFGGGGGMRMARTIRMEGGDAPPEAPWTEVTVAEGGQHELTLVAPERARVVGRVREGGRALAGATVRLRTKGGEDTPFFEEGPKAETDGLGEYALENVTVGEYVLTVSHPTRAMPYESDLRVGSGETRENVELPLSIVEGRITDEEGKGVAGLRVRAERESGGDSVVREFVFAVDSGDGPISFGSGGGGQVTTNAEGRYTLRGVVPDTDLTVVASGQGVQRTESESVRVPVDGTRSGVDLVARKGAGLEVTCRRPDGSPATPCEVRAELQAEDDSDMKLEITRGDGKARFQGLKPGRWRVTARDLGAGPDDRERTPTEQTIDLKVGTAPQQLTLEIRGG